MTFPNWVLVTDNRIPELGTNEVLRANFWFYKLDESGLGDESIHDHPRAFQSYIVSGGYEHVIYSTVNDPKKIFSVNLLDFFQQNIFPNFGINYNFNSANITKTFQFAMDKSINTISYQGTTLLEASHVESTKKGDIIEIDTQLIHRVTKYHLFAEEKTLSLNIVRDKGKMITNVFLPEMKIASVKTEREAVSPEEAIVATDELIALFSKHSQLG